MNVLVLERFYIFEKRDSDENSCVKKRLKSILLHLN